MKGGAGVDKHATTNVHKTSFFIQMSRGKKKKGKKIRANDPTSVPSALSQSQLENDSLALLKIQGSRALMANQTTAKLNK